MEESNFKENTNLNIGWSELTKEVQQFAGDKLSNEFKEKARFSVEISGAISFCLDEGSEFNHGISVRDIISGEISVEGKRIVLNHLVEQFAPVIESNDPEAGGGSSIMSIPEYHRFGVVWNGQGKDASIFIVAKDWQANAKIDANGVVDLSEKNKRQMEEHFGSALGLVNGIKIDLNATVKSFSNPMKYEDVINFYNETLTLESGLPIPHLPVVLSRI